MSKMKVIFGLLVIALFAVTSAQAFACGGETAEAGEEKKVQAAANEIVDVSVETLAARLEKKDESLTVVDVNNASLREEAGKIPGAVLLSNYKEFDAVKELPGAKDQDLVFYCASMQCGASHKAAVRAQEQGYTSVQVLKAGIRGWKEAGQATETVAAVGK